MTKTDQIAARLGGIPVHCEHSQTIICRRCPVPLHVAGDAQATYQFHDAFGAVTFLRANYDAVMAAR